MRRHVFELMMEAAGQILDAVGQGVLDAFARRRTGPDDSGGEKTQTGGYAQSRQRIIGDVRFPVERLLKAITQPVHGIRDRFTPGCDVLTNLFRAAFGDSLWGALNPTTVRSRREEIATRFDELLRQRIAADPETAACEWHVVVLDIAKP